MAVVSINYKKIVAEKIKDAFKGQITIKNSMSINNVVSGVMHPGANQLAVVFEYTYAIHYEPQVGVISITGSVVDIEPEEKAKEIVDLWDKTKRVEKELTRKIISIILDKCNIKAIVMSQDIGLPSPIPLPKVKVDDGSIPKASATPVVTKDNKDDEITINSKDSKKNKDNSSKKSR